MALAKRIFYFMLINILVMFTVSILTAVVCQFLYGQPYPPDGGSTVYIAVWSGVWGMGGAFISLMLSKFMAKRMTGMQLIDPNTTDSRAREIVDMVHKMARNARLKKMPEVGVYESPEMNAFATGPSRNNSLVAVSTGLLNKMDRHELEGVLGHEVAHIANGDMVTMTLIQGIVNAFALFFARIIARVAAAQMDRDSFWVEYGIYMVLQMVFLTLGMIPVAFFSRAREYRADAGGAKYSSRQNMMAALKVLQRETSFDPRTQKEDALAAFKISSRPKTGGIVALFRTHPPLEDRIARLQRGI